MFNRPRYSMPELEGDWFRLRNDQKFQAHREDIAHLREAMDAVLSSLGMAKPQDNYGWRPRTESLPSLKQLSRTVDDIQHDLKDVIRRLDALERKR